MIPIIDIHCHPSLKVYFYNIDLFEKHDASPDFNPFSARVDLPKMQEGNVQAIFCTHYLPELYLKTECHNVSWAYNGIKFLAPDAADKLENDVDFNSAFEQTLQMIDLFDSKVHESRSKGWNVEVARNFEQFKKGFEEGRIMIIHAIEGAHSIGHTQGKFSADKDDYVKNLEVLHQKGVCLITLAHFFRNDLVFPVNGIPPTIRNLLGVKPADLNKSITPLGEYIVKTMFEMGILVDLTHCTPAARQKVFEIGEGKYPIVFSHTGVEKIFNNPDLPDDRFMNPSDEEIRKIAECGGVIGVIADNYWLTGKEEKHWLLKEPGFEYIYQTINHIYKVTGNYDNIAFGSDLDGLTDPSDDIKDCSKYPDLINFLKEKGISQEDLNKIASGNILRVLETGWK